MRWRRRVLAGLLGVVGVGYAGVHAMVSGARSPTTESIVLPGGERLAYLSRGPTGAVGRVLLIHGAPTDASSWDLVMAEPALAGAAVVVPDRLGYGNSAGGGDRWGDGRVETSLAAHAASLDGLIGPGTVVVGHSYGGPVALRVAAMYPERVAGVVLVASASDPGMDDAMTVRGAVDNLRAVVPASWSVANRELMELTRERALLEPMLGRVVCPVVVLHGTWDPVCPHDGETGYLERALVNAASVEITSVPRAGHNIHRSHPELVAEAAARLMVGSRMVGRSQD